MLTLSTPSSANAEVVGCCCGMGDGRMMALISRRSRKGGSRMVDGCLTNFCVGHTQYIGIGT